MTSEWIALDESMPQLNSVLKNIDTIEADNSRPEATVGTHSYIDVWKMGFAIYLCIAMGFGFRFIIGLAKIFERIRNSTGKKLKSYILLKHVDGGPPSSFFSFIFVDDSFDEYDSITQEQIVAHERIHIEEKHSWDVLLIELLRVIYWFNPFVYLYRKTIQEVHEYIADEKTSQIFNRYEYSRLLVRLSGHKPTLSMVNGFAKSLISSRIQILVHPVKYNRDRKIWVLPIAFLLTGIFSCDFSFEQKPLPASSALTVDSLAVPIEIPLSKKNEELNYIPAIKPVDAKVDAAFGMRTHPIMKSRRMHTGVDFIVPIGTPVRATADGIVKIVGTQKGGYGIQIELAHDSGKGEIRFETKYAHLLSVEVTKGQSVKQGDVIGYSGNSGLSIGPHLHYEVIDKSRKVNPEIYFPQDSLPTENQYFDRNMSMD